MLVFSALLMTSMPAAVTAPAPAPAPAHLPVHGITHTVGAAELRCVTQASAEQLSSRLSPLDSVGFHVGSVAVKVCYGRPSARGRTVFGGVVPLDRLWRTGANEPTMIHLDGPLRLAGMQLDAGSYSLYTVPGDTEWQVVVNRSTSQWGHTRQYTAEVEAQEVGRATVARHTLDTAVETFTIRYDERATGAGALVLEWERTGVEIPVEPSGS